MKKQLRKLVIKLRDSLDVLVKPGPLLYYTHIENFGDLINRDLYLWLFSREPANAFSAGRWARKPRMSAIGSHLAAIKNTATLVWGTGFLSSELQPSCRLRNVCAVRGPLSRKKLVDAGIECPKRFGDPALLSPLLYGRPAEEGQPRIKLVPHFSDRNEPCWEKIAEKHDCDLIDVRHAPVRVIHEIATASLVISSSLHGLIVGVAYGIPVLWYRPTDKPKGDGFKFVDFFEALGIPNVKPVKSCDNLIEASPFELAICAKPDLVLSQREELLAQLYHRFPGSLSN